ncbi:MAG: hypothetical protein KBD24_02060 [Candidatus Pacebacteria bacterium]|nr:hypothetical protein [Candidatus Paceibacterota bacterium]
MSDFEAFGKRGDDTDTDAISKYFGYKNTGGVTSNSPPARGINVAPGKPIVVYGNGSRGAPAEKTKNTKVVMSDADTKELYELLRLSNASSPNSTGKGIGEEKTQRVSQFGARPDLAREQRSVSNETDLKTRLESIVGNGDMVAYIGALGNVVQGIKSIEVDGASPIPGTRLAQKLNTLGMIIYRMQGGDISAKSEYETMMRRLPQIPESIQERIKELVAKTSKTPLESTAGRITSKVNEDRKGDSVPDTLSTTKITQDTLEVAVSGGDDVIATPTASNGAPSIVSHPENRLLSGEEAKGTLNGKSRRVLHVAPPASQSNTVVPDEEVADLPSPEKIITPSNPTTRMESAPDFSHKVPEGSPKDEAMLMVDQFKKMKEELATAEADSMKAALKVGRLRSDIGVFGSFFTNGSVAESSKHLEEKVATLYSVIDKLLLNRDDRVADARKVVNASTPEKADMCAKLLSQCEAILELNVRMADIERTSREGSSHERGAREARKADATSEYVKNLSPEDLKKVWGSWDTVPPTNVSWGDTPKVDTVQPPIATEGGGEGEVTKGEGVKPTSSAPDAKSAPTKVVVETPKVTVPASTDEVETPPSPEGAPVAKVTPAPEASLTEHELAVARAHVEALEEEYATAIVRFKEMRKTVDMKTPEGREALIKEFDTLQAFEDALREARIVAGDTRPVTPFVLPDDVQVPDVGTGGESTATVPEVPVTPTAGTAETVTTSKEVSPEVLTAFTRDFKNITKEELESIEGFGDLTVDQQLFVLHNLRQSALLTIQTESVKEYRSDQATAGWLRRSWLGLTKAHQLAKNRKDITSDIFSGAVDQKETLTALTDMVSQGPLVERLADGSFNISFIGEKDFTGEVLTEEERTLLGKFNTATRAYSTLAPELRTGHTWEQAQHEETEKDYKKYRTEILALLERREGKEVALRIGNEIDQDVTLNRYLDVCPDVEQQLTAIRDEKVWLQTVKQMGLSRGGYFALGGGVRMFTVGALGFAAAPLAGAVVGGVRARGMAKETLHEEELLSRMGSDWNTQEHNELRAIKQMTEARNVIDATTLVGKLDDLLARIDATEDESEKAALLARLHARITYTEEKVRGELVNYGSVAERSAQQLNTLQALGRAYTYGELPEDDKLEERLEHFLGVRAKAIDERQRKFVNKRMWKGVRMGAGFAFAGALAGQVVRDWWHNEDVSVASQAQNSVGVKASGSVAEPLPGKPTVSSGSEQGRMLLDQTSDFDGDDFFKKYNELLESNLPADKRVTTPVVGTDANKVEFGTAQKALGEWLHQKLPHKPIDGAVGVEQNTPSGKTPPILEQAKQVSGMTRADFDKPFKFTPAANLAESIDSVEYNIRELNLNKFTSEPARFQYDGTYKPGESVQRVLINHLQKEYPNLSKAEVGRVVYNLQQELASVKDPGVAGKLREMFSVGERGNWNRVQVNKPYHIDIPKSLVDHFVEKVHPSVASVDNATGLSVDSAERHGMVPKDVSKPVRFSYDTHLGGSRDPVGYIQNFDMKNITNVPDAVVKNTYSTVAPMAESEPLPGKPTVSPESEQGRMLLDQTKDFDESAFPEDPSQTPVMAPLDKNQPVAFTDAARLGEETNTGERQPVGVSSQPILAVETLSPLPGEPTVSSESEQGRMLLDQTKDFDESAFPEDPAQTQAMTPLDKNQPVAFTDAARLGVEALSPSDQHAQTLTNMMRGKDFPYATIINKLHGQRDNMLDGKNLEGVGAPESYADITATRPLFEKLLGVRGSFGDLEGVQKSALIDAWDLLGSMRVRDLYDTIPGQTYKLGKLTVSLSGETEQLMRGIIAELESGYKGSFDVRAFIDLAQKGNVTVSDLVKRIADRAGLS